MPKTFEDCCENAISVISDLTGGVAFSKMYTSTSFVVDFIFFQIENELVITSKLSNGAVLEVKLNNVKNMNLIDGTFYVSTYYYTYNTHKIPLFALSTFFIYIPLPMCREVQKERLDILSQFIGPQNTHMLFRKIRRILFPLPFVFICITIPWMKVSLGFSECWDKGEHRQPTTDGRFTHRR